ncbi:hypothetical protein ABIB80_004616 [Bradyrhizobium sp. i1.15.2]
MPASASRRRTNCSALSWIKPARAGKPQTAGVTLPVHSPKPIVAKPSRLHYPVIELRRRPPGTIGARRRDQTAWWPHAVISSGLPRLPSVVPETVPDPSRSPVSRLHLLLVWCVTNWAGLQYRPRVQAGLTVRAAVMPAARRAQRTSMSIAPDCLSAWACRCGKGRGSCSSRGNAVTRNGSSTSAVTIHGETFGR